MTALRHGDEACVSLLPRGETRGTTLARDVVTRFGRKKAAWDGVNAHKEQRPAEQEKEPTRMWAGVVDSPPVVRKPVQINQCELP